METLIFILHIIGYIITTIATIILLIGIYAVYSSYIVYKKIQKLDNDGIVIDINNITEQAKTIFRWNILARRIFIKTITSINSKLQDEYNIDCEMFTRLDRKTIQSIKKRYKELAKIYHPDKGGSDTKFNELVKCKDFLIRNKNV